MSVDTWLAFFVASWIISFSPGSGAIYAMSCGLNHGFRRGFIGTFGLIAGIMTALAVVAVGLGAVLSTSTHAFTALKWLGVAYLVYLGLKQWRASPVPMAAVDRDAPNVSARTLMVKGWAVNATNPKGLVFMMAVMPQFIDSQAALWSQYLAIAATMACTDFVAMAIYTAFAARVLAFFRSEAQIRFLNRLFGGLFVAAATALATFKRASA
ncbi:LysE family transporter [Casimicrobium huifangae]|uniref:LysE family transporter n=1 Tax=Casimicrobium huifangae TaxID=2591109 RepID=UPI0037831F18